MKRLLPLIVLCGCTLGPDYKRPQLELPAQYPEPAPAEAQALAPQWWRLYSDKQRKGRTLGDRHPAAPPAAAGWAMATDSAVSSTAASCWSTCI